MENINVDSVAALREAGYVVKIWSPEDVSGFYLDNRDEFGIIPPESVPVMVAEALSTGAWEALGDCNDSDWYHVEGAIREALDSMRGEV